MKIFEINFRYSRNNTTKVYFIKYLVISKTIEKAKEIFWNENEWLDRVDGMIYNINEREFKNNHLRIS